MSRLKGPGSIVLKLRHRVAYMKIPKLRVRRADLVEYYALAAREINEFYQFEKWGWIYGKESGGCWETVIKDFFGPDKERLQKMFLNWQDAGLVLDLEDIPEPEIPGGYQLIGMLHNHPTEYGSDLLLPSLGDEKVFPELMKEKTGKPFGVMGMTVITNQPRPYDDGWLNENLKFWAVYPGKKEEVQYKTMDS